MSDDSTWIEDDEERRARTALGIANGETVALDCDAGDSNCCNGLPEGRQSSVAGPGRGRLGRGVWLMAGLGLRRRMRGRRCRVSRRRGLCWSLRLSWMGDVVGVGVVGDVVVGVAVGGEDMVVVGRGSVHDTPRIAQTLICIQYVGWDIRGGRGEKRRQPSRSRGIVLITSSTVRYTPT
jgi:hypothetical protein